MTKRLTEKTAIRNDIVQQRQKRIVGSSKDRYYIKTYSKTTGSNLHVNHSDMFWANCETV